MEHIGTVGIRELKQNASAVVARAVEGETVTITDRGRPVAVISGLRQSPLDELVDGGLVTTPSSPKKIWEIRLPQATLSSSVPASLILDELREDRL